jgi:hypothetical protein
MPDIILSPAGLAEALGVIARSPQHLQASNWIEKLDSL